MMSLTHMAIRSVAGFFRDLQVLEIGVEGRLALLKRQGGDHGAALHHQGLQFEGLVHL